MRKALSITLMLVVALAVPALAKPVDQSGGLQKFMMAEEAPQPNMTSNTGVFGVSAAVTTYFGGTVWAADSARWEAVQDGIWTFDSGVGSHYDFTAPYVNPTKWGANGETPPLHAMMEGWLGYDFTFGNLPYFRRIDSGDISCVLNGSYSMYAGVFEQEAKDMCWPGWADGGYGNSWFMCMSRDTNFGYVGTPVSMSYAYVADTEPDYDYTFVIVDTTGSDDGTADVVVDASITTGVASGTMNLAFVAGVDMRSDAGPFNIKVCMSSDGGWSDQDGSYVTSCGALVVDDITVAGCTGAGSWNFEADAGGWRVSPPVAGLGGDWSNIVSQSDLPPVLNACGCDFTVDGKDTVMVFEDLTVGGHGYYQDNVAFSPWIDLLAAGQVGVPIKFARFDAYMELPSLNYIYFQWWAQWSPELCPITGQLIKSGFQNDNTVWYFGGVPQCRQWGPVVDRAVYQDYSAYIAPGAEQVRFALGMINMDQYWGPGTGITNSTPWIDNVRFGVAGDPGTPYLTAKAWDRLQDSFPESGTLALNKPGRFDSNNVLNGVTGAQYTILGDTLVVLGGKGGAEVYVQFAVDPGPGCAAAVASWIAAEPGIVFQENKDGLAWYAARIDTAEVKKAMKFGFWMTTYHETSASFAGKDTDKDLIDLGPKGDSFRMANDIFPDDLFTPGTRVNLFFKAKFTTGTTWFTYPDTSLTFDKYEEFEVLPSSMTADGDFNCVLYVDHYTHRGAQQWIEPALGSVLSTSSENYEGVAWDRWNVQAPSSDQLSFGRALNTEFGATILQALGYKAIIWNSGDLPSYTVVKEDADVLIPWLSLTEATLGFNNLYLNGNDLAESITNEGIDEPSAIRLLNEFCGVSFTCAAFLDPACPDAMSVQDTTGCVPVDPVTGAVVANSLGGGRNVQHTVQGNGCPQTRSFDVIDTFIGGLGSPVPDEEYNGPIKGVVQYTSVSNSVSGGPDYKTVVDGASLHYRRDSLSPCVFGTASATPEPAIAERLEEVLTWFGYADSTFCSDPTAGTSVPVDPRQPSFKTGLANFAPNPLLNGAKGTIQFTLSRDSKAAVEIFDVNGRLVRTVFDGVAKEGLNVVHWDGTDSGSRPVASGVYFYRLKANEEEFAKKLVVVRNGN